MIPRNFTLFPTLTTERTTLRQLSIDDQQHIFALRSDAEINKYLDRLPVQTIEEAINFINKVTDNIKKTTRFWVPAQSPDRGLCASERITSGISTLLFGPPHSLPTGDCALRSA